MTSHNDKSPLLHFLYLSKTIFMERRGLYALMVELGIKHQSFLTGVWHRNCGSACPQHKAISQTGSGEDHFARRTWVQQCFIKCTLVVVQIKTFKYIGNWNGAQLSTIPLSKSNNPSGCYILKQSWICKTTLSNQQYILFIPKYKCIYIQKIM